MAGQRRNLSAPSHQKSRRHETGPTPVAFFLWTIFLVSAAIAYLWIYNQNDIVAVELDEQLKVVVEMENINLELEAAIGQLTKIDRITRIARTELDMVVPPAESLIVYIPEFEK